MSRMAEIAADAEESRRFFDDPATGMELDLHTMDGALAHVRELIAASPWLAGAYREDFTELATEFKQLAEGEFIRGVS